MPSASEPPSDVQPAPERDFLVLEEVLAATLAPLDGLSVADIGAGSGRVTRALASMGAVATGVEPNAEAVAAAQAEGGADFIVAPAEATGLYDGAFDVALFSHSLHHVADMAAALDEARRILRPGGRLAVMEPEAPDPSWPVVRWIDDESDVYAAAQRALVALTDAGRVCHERTLRYATRYRVESAEALIGEMLAVDPGRSVSESDRARVAEAFAAGRRRDAQGSYLVSWERMDVFRLPGD